VLLKNIGDTARGTPLAQALIDNGAVKPIVSFTYPLMDARKAFEASRTHKAPGKVILQVR